MIPKFIDLIVFTILSSHLGGQYKNRIYNRTSRGCMISLLYLFLIPAIILAYIAALESCSGDDTSAKKPVYIRPSIDNKGKFRKGYVRKPISTSMYAIKNQNRSRYFPLVGQSLTRVFYLGCTERCTVFGIFLSGS